MNIAIDVLAILGPGSKNRGIGNYTTSQLKKMFELDKVNNYFLVNFYEDTSLKDILQYGENVTEHYFYIGHNNFLSKNPSYKEMFGKLVKKFIRNYQIEVFYFTSVFDGSISYDMDWFSEVTTIGTLYDVIPYVFKERYLNNKNIHNEYMGQLSNFLKMDKLLAISQSAKDDVIQNFKFEPNKIDVIYAGTDEWFKKVDLEFKDINGFKKKYNLVDDYIMCTGGDDDRKNIGSLIIAFSKMPIELSNKYQLVVACKLSKESEERYYNLATKHNLRERVILTNFVPLDDLIMLYNLAYVVAFPSQYEGFGLPIIEAMACGTPVLTSNNSSLGEIAEGAAVLVNPFEIEDITRGLVEILSKEDLSQLTELGFERIKKFTWEKVSLTTINAFEPIKKEIHGSLLEKKTKSIAFFTPLPPLKSGISDYSVDILNELSNYFNIDVFIDKGYVPDCALATNISVYEYSQFDSMYKRYSDIVYQVGNSEYHAYMLENIKKYNGTVVLHDHNLHGLLHFIASKKGDFDLYKRYLYEDYNTNLINEYIDRIKSGKSKIMEFDFPTNGAFTNNAKKIIVHSDYSRKLLLEKDISKNVRKIHSYAKIEAIVDKDEARRKLKMESDKIVISAFGHIHETKRIVPIVKAFKKVLEDHNDVLLYLVGKPSPSIKEELEQYIKTHNLHRNIVVTGYVSLEVFEDYIDATDICLNLRYPYNGETSGSLMRILAKGKCSLVSSIGSFSEIPDECCVKLQSPEFMMESDEVDMIYNHVSESIGKPDRIKMYEKNAREYALQELDIKIIAKQYADFIMDQSTSVLTESKLLDIRNMLQNENKLYNIDIYKIAETLSYL